METGEAMVTDAGFLKCFRVIHAVGPKCQENQEDISAEKEVLKITFKNIFRMIVSNNFKRTSICAISTGLYNFPIEEWVNAFVETFTRFVKKHQNKMDGREIILCKYLLLTLFFNVKYN